MSKTRKFTYEGSSKLIKFIYLIGMILLNISTFSFIIWSFYSLYCFLSNLSNQNLNEQVFTEIGILMLIPITIGILGRSIVSIAQFLNWWDRGSINSKIFK